MESNDPFERFLRFVRLDRTDFAPAIPYALHVQVFAQNEIDGDPLRTVPLSSRLAGGWYDKLKFFPAVCFDGTTRVVDHHTGKVSGERQRRQLGQ